MEYDHILVMNKKNHKMCQSDTLTWLIKHLFQRDYLTKSVPYVTNLK